MRAKKKQTIKALVAAALAQLCLLLMVNVSSGQVSPEPMDGAYAFCNVCYGGCSVMGCGEATCRSYDCGCACACDGVRIRYTCDPS